MRKIVFDIETRNFFHDVGKNDPTLLDVAVVGIHDSATDTYSTYEAEELNKLWSILEQADILIGFNTDHFDIPLLNKYYPGDIGKIKSIDLLKEIRNTCGRRMRLDQLAEGTLGKNKTGHGSDSTMWWKQGEIQKIKDYCLQDVMLTKELYEYALAHKKLIFKEGGKLNEIALDTSSWEIPHENKLTFTLPF